jgi:antitoxin component YwqK of YwqJK toxin-antitoxin module
MKIHWFIVCFISTLWMGCGSIKDSSNPLRPEPVKTNQGTLYVHPDTKQPFHGVYDVVENGVRLKFEIKDGLPHGRMQRWYRSGQPHEDYNQFKRLRDGLQRSWYPNGQLMLEADFRGGKMLSARTWDLSGSVASTITNGSGTLILFDTKGQKRRESVYIDGSKQ